MSERSRVLYDFFSECVFFVLLAFHDGEPLFMRKVDKIIITLLLITAFEHERSQVEKQFFATDAIEPCQC